MKTLRALRFICLIFVGLTANAATTINVQSYGATGNGSTDDTAAINKAIAAIPASGATVYFPCGTYLVSASLTPVTVSNVTIAGAPSCSEVKRTGNNGESTLQIGGLLLSASTPLLAISPELTNTFSANLSNLGGLKTGDYVFLEEGTDANHTCSISGCRGEVLQIQSVTGNTATVTTAVHHTYDPVQYAAWVEKIKSPISGIAIHDLTFDGSGTAYTAIYLMDTVNSTVYNVTVQNFAQEGILAKVGYNLSWKNIVLTHTGAAETSSMYLHQQGKLSVSNLSLSNLNYGAFGFTPEEESDGTFSNITIDSAGTGWGRPMKLNASVYNTFDNVTVRNGEGTGDNGISLLYFSSHNTFNNCVVENNTQNGIMGFGDTNGYSRYNTFNNCTVSGNSIYQVAVKATNDYWTFNGGTYTSVTNQYNMGFFDAGQINGYYVHNVTFNGPGVYGIYLIGNNHCIDNNKFQGFYKDVLVTGTDNLGSANTTPDGVSGLVSGSCPNTSITPVVTSAASASGTMGSPFTYQITATNGPSLFSASGLPTGLSINTATGLISGVPSSAGTSTVLLGAANSDGAGSETLTLKVSGVSAQAPVIQSFGATPASIMTGQSSTLSWQVAGASNLSISPTIGPVSGTSVSVSPAATTTFTLTATNSVGSVSAKTTVTVQPPLPTINTFTANPVAIASGASSTLSWSVTGASSVNISPGVGAVTGTSRAVSPTTTTTYILTAVNSGGSVTRQVQVAVSGSGRLINVQSYGATGNGSTDDTSAIDSAIAAIPSSGATLFFPCGTYLVSSQLSAITKSHVTITGPAGATNCATLASTGAGSFPIFYAWSGGLSASASLVSDSLMGSNQFTLGSGRLSAIDLAAGDYALASDVSKPIDSQEVVKLASVSGDTATIEGTFSSSFQVSNSGSVQKLIQSVDDLHITYLNFDGSRNATQYPANSSVAMSISFATNSEIGYVNVSNFLGTGATGGITMDTGYSNAVHDTHISSAGNPRGTGYYGLGLIRQSYTTIKNIQISQGASQDVFSMGLNDFHFGTLSNIYIDAAEAVGAPFKLLKASHNTINNLTVLHGAGGHNGISVTGFSQYNTFNNCVSEYNSGAGIATAGDQNVHNTFVNCTSLYNQLQFGQGADASGNYGDSYTMITGGKFGCTRNEPLQGGVIIQMNSTGFVMTGATIYDDENLALEGLLLGAGFTNLTLKNNDFSNLYAGRDIYALGSNPNSVICGNQVPDGTTPASLNAAVSCSQ